MKDVKLLCELRNSAIFHKSLEQDLRNIEFYTNTPCFIYIESGVEVITSNSHEVITLTPGDSIFLPQGLSLHSDYVKETRSLKAKLVFFNDDEIAIFLNKFNRAKEHNVTDCDYLYLDESEYFGRYFDSINYDISDESYLSSKFQELLYLIDYADKSKKFYSLLSTMKRLPPKKNLMRLLDTVETLHLSVGDLAHLSGRSVSSINRDFKAIYQVTAKQWLLDNRLSKAKDLLETESHSVTDVAMMVGYSNVSHFIKSFKCKYGVTPKTLITGQ
jgi:AraC-like DNA-binding protein